MNKIHSNWILLPPGNTAILRFPFYGKIEDIPLPSGLSNPRLATLAEVIVANQGNPYPWGSYPEALPTKTSRLWKEKRIGVGGLVHDNWFVTSQGRVGGAPNVAETGEDALRYFMYLQGGRGPNGLRENEGWAVVCDVQDSEIAYRKIQLRAAKRVVADTGSIIVSPKDDEDVFHIGFVGGCQHCPNAELISFPATQSALPDIKLALHPDWQGWKV